MKKISTLFIAGALLLTTGSGLLAQNMNKQYTSGSNEGIDYAPSDEYILSGNFNPPTVNGWSNAGSVSSFNLGRIQLQKLDNQLNTVWFKTYVTMAEQNAILDGTCPKLAVDFRCGYAKHTSDGGYIVCGKVRVDPETSGCSGSTYDHLFLLKVDANGNVMWYKRYNKYGMLNSVTETAGGNFMACGIEGGSGLGTSLIICTDPSGNLLWSKNTLTPSYWDNTVVVPSEYYQVIQYNGINALVGVASTMGNTWGGLVLTLIDDAGNYIQNQILDNEADKYTLVGRGLADAGDGDLVITGFSNQPCLTTLTLMLMKIDPYAMNVKFLKYYTTDYSWGNGVTVFAGGRIAATGINYTNNSAVYIETDFSGNLNRYVLYNNPEAVTGKSMTHNTAIDVPVFSGNPGAAPAVTFVVKNDQNYDCPPDIYVPSYDPPYIIYPSGDKDAGVVQIDDDAVAYDMLQSEWLVCGWPHVAAKPGTTALQAVAHAVLPNPATDIVKIDAGIADYAGATLKISDVSGRTMLTKKITQSDDLSKVDVSGLVPGMYIATVEAAKSPAVHISFVKE